jgi:hypothetical protein
MVKLSLWLINTLETERERGEREDKEEKRKKRSEEKRRCGTGVVRDTTFKRGEHNFVWV